ncbi:splicing factor Cactin [Lepeophtheirus salmonis]|uniref:splicing factor Cactin n=1 Tax=Lepeophtheirus salmonis TaxID=72036 RepID=UPI001AE34EB6|nr:cactin-like [Lepeophtheirus salmonis]
MGRSEKKKKKKSSKKRRHRSPSTSSSSSSDDDHRHRKSQKKKSRRRRHESSSDTDSSTDLLLRLEKERMELKKRKRREKESMKARETPEEKRARRLLKKESKNRKMNVEMGWNDEVRYTNEDNPFGDSQLTENFRWDAKLKKEGLESLSEKDYSKLQRLKVEETRQELEKVKKARLEREREREERQTLLELQERSKENDKFVKWRQDEDEFHLKQARTRSQIRIQDGRAKPIDLLAKYITSEENECDAILMHEPYTYLNGLTLIDLEDLLADIKIYVEIDLQKNKDFWADITTIVHDELYKLRKMDEVESRRQGIHKSVTHEVNNIFKDKTSKELQLLQESIEVKLSGVGEGIDVGYWETLLGQLKAHLARARLKERHDDNLKNKLEVLKAEQANDHIKKLDKNKESSPELDEEPGPSRDVESEMLNPALEEYEKGNYSPHYRNEDELELGAIVISEEEDANRRKSYQAKALKGVRVESAMSAEERALEREAKKGMKDDEASFSVESALEQTYEWSDKYRPRKPRYFNRVHTGFEWNKYNQTHYDVDNPPPKIVQGYKFNIFYPDLIDKSGTPSYTLRPCAENRDFCILRIHVGPPYEDIAFKIVNREWEYGYKRGFKCQFHNNIFQLWFHFKRLRYRR